MFKIIYILSIFIAYIIFSPFLFISIFKKKYKKSIPSRFFLKNFSLLNMPEIWFHACSYGEIKSLECIIKKNPNKSILITTITNTGFELAKKTYENNPYIEVKYLPFEIFIPFWIYKLARLKTLVVLEAELWYMIFFIAKKSGGKTILLNARISDRSFGRYKKLRWFYKILFKKVDKVFTQGQKDLERFEILGGKNIEVLGNIKNFNIPQITKYYPKQNFPIFVAASTHKGEEELILNAFLEFKKTFKEPVLIMLPRHPERFDEVENIIKQKQCKVKVFSKDGFDLECDVLLVDKLGELNNIYSITDVVILGGSFVKVGGHNPIEPAFFNTKLITGKYIFNQNSLFGMIEGYELIEEQELLKALLNFKNLIPTRLKNKEDKLKILLEEIYH